MSQIERQKVVSSDVASIGYDAATQTLEIEFRATGIYRYFSVPRATYDGLIQTPSPGKFFLQHIKGKYAWEKASEQQGKPDSSLGNDEAPEDPKATTS